MPGDTASAPPASYPWRAKYGGRGAEDAKRLKEPASENRRLKRLLAEAHLDIKALKIGFGVKRWPGNASAGWSMDLVSDALASGRRIKGLTVAEDFTHESVDIAVDHGIG